MEVENNLSSDFLGKKAFEVSYALFRVAASLKSRALIEEIEKVGARLLVFISEGNYQDVATTLTAIEYLLRICLETEMIHPANCQLIINEAGMLKSSIFQSKTPEIKGLEDVFKEKAMPMPGSETEKNSSEISSEIVLEKLKNKENSSEMNNDTRPRVILKKIEELGSCRLGDLLSIFPNLSSRMIRYELQNLMEKRLIEKVGNSGPLVYYKLKRKEISGLPATLETIRLSASLSPLAL